ncbi:MAG TPA: cytochrome c [Verrucomicrobiae bacterium]|jgi:mono/diheme cytochrome c family protein|nr:cytochrome c [Verrucomicrobiae bacterium]
MQWIILIGALVIFSFSSPASTWAQSKGDANAGKAKYESLCAGCHGKTGKGDGPAAASLNPKPQDHTDGKVMNALSDQYLTDIVKNGGASVKKSPLMPAWGKTLKDQEVADVIAYIRSLANPPYKSGK